ncbi:NADPH-dependent F420 reductase [Spirosoma radiotolerans]|uniref:3-hydroxyisobutyrate dehydrogenase n=1 Tax=Spirosoma radiotolerans TaxID=1379870 RepID=A0A0E3V8W8_9BACT|nr:NAD(P)-binding domain-containing protein [Spirosoma radiotolerans]AKD57152.1 3-hydroxyisobutyrate dehydrogenase [Spirosoma radiotolerans]
MKQPIGIIGTGNVGSVLAKRLVALGYPVKATNSRGPGSMHAFAAETGTKAVSLDDITQEVDMLILAIPFGRISEVSRGLQLPEKIIVVDASNYYPDRDGAIRPVDQGLPESVWTAQQLAHPVVKAFNSIMAYSLDHNASSGQVDHRIALPVSGDDPLARATVGALVKALGFASYDAGGLAASWRQQPGQPAYCTDASLDELPVLLSKANPTRAAQRRDQAVQAMARLPSTFPPQKLIRVSRLSAGLDRFKWSSWSALIHLGYSLLRA